MECIDLGSKKLDYKLKRSKRKTLSIAVDAKCEVSVLAPDYIPIEKIEEILQKRKDWIFQKIQEKENNLQIQPKRKYVSGESLYLFGRQYYLKIIKSNENHVELAHNRINFYVKDLSEAEKLITQYIDNEFRTLISTKSKECLETFRENFSIYTVPNFKIRKMVKRWGSCTQNGVINISPKLATAPIECIEYVIYHELTHLIHDNHSEEFYSALKKVCPKHKELKDRLESEAVLFED